MGTRLPYVSPIQNTATIFVSKAMQNPVLATNSESTNAFTIKNEAEETKHHDYLEIFEDGSVASTVPLLNPSNQW
jgi:hypothetical protein